MQILSPLLEPDSIDDKLSVLDLSVQDKHGRRYAVEMQCQNHSAFAERMLYYATRRFSEQLRSGKEYRRLQRLVLIVFTDFVLFPEIDSHRERFELRGVISSVPFTGHLTVLLVQLPQYKKRAAEAASLGEKWISFLKEGSNLETQILDDPWVTPELRKAMEELERLAGDEKTRQLYEAKLRHTQILATHLRDSFEEGHEKGREEGHEEGRVEGRAEGRAEGLAASVKIYVRQRFGAVPDWLEVRLREQHEDEPLRDFFEAAIAAKSLEELRVAIEPAGS